MKLGVVGLPNVGKSTLFNALTKAGAESANYPFCTIDPNVGIVTVPDERLDKLAEMYHPEKYTPAIVEFVDIAGLVKGASRGEGLGNRFLSHIREVDAVLHVVRCFEDGNIVHVEGSVDPIRDIETINLELIFADLETLEKRLGNLKKSAKNGDKTLLDGVALLERLQQHLEAGQPVRSFPLEPEQRAFVREMFFLTAKPVIYAANIHEDDIGKAPEDLPLVARLMEQAAKEGAEVMVVSARMEEEIAQLDDEERAAFLEELGIGQSGLDQLIRACYRLLGLISFLTAGPKEVRAWTITKGTLAPQAAGKIHTDFERGFIRAEVVAYDALMEAGSMAAAKERGWVRLEGKDYEMKDGDIVVFRFNV